MRVGLRRIVRKFAVLRFEVGGSILWDDISLVRQYLSTPLFQWLCITSAGKKKDYVSGLVLLSTCKFVTTGGLYERRLINSFANIDTNGMVHMKDAAAVEEWEKHLVAVAPELADRMAEEKGEELLSATLHVRDAADQYLSHFTRVRYTEVSKCDPSLIAAAERLAGWPGVLQIAGLQKVYLTACLLIVQHAPTIEQDGRTYGGADPLEDEGLMQRIQLVADGILQRVGGPQAAIADDDGG